MLTPFGPGERCGPRLGLGLDRIGPSSQQQCDQLHTAPATRPPEGRTLQECVWRRSRHHTPFAYHLHVEDVGHTLVLGATGSGKSFLLNFIVTNAQQYGPFTIILDLGHGCRKLAALLHGGYVELGLRQHAVSITPFSLEPTPEHLHVLHGFVRVLLEGEDGYRLSEFEDREVYEAVENLYVLDRTRGVFERYNIVSAGDLREAARRLDIATGTISGTIEQNQRSGSKA